MKQLAFVIELDRCIGCKGCQVSCKLTNGTHLGSDRIKVRQIGPFGTHPKLQMYFLPTMCQQCEDPACIKGCPSNAIYKSKEDGVVRIDQKKCIGCQSCNQQCPYQANTYSVMTHTMDKCTLCSTERANGDGPACIKNCTGKALHFGDINDPQSEVSQLLAEAGADHIFHLPDSGNRPSARYILKTAQWQDVLPPALDQVSFTRKGGK